ncbi:hypothetical protein DIPPA_31467 [Diplonema papillatum]|nr:hypothetical protein DIPPA_31467 [Diplonema papillatum]
MYNTPLVVSPEEKFRTQLTEQVGLTHDEVDALQEHGVENLSKLLNFVGSGEHSRCGLDMKLHYRIEKWYWAVRRKTFSSQDAHTDPSSYRKVMRVGKKRNGQAKQVEEKQKARVELGGITPTAPRRHENGRFDPWTKSSDEYGAVSKREFPNARDEGRVFPVIDYNKPNMMSWEPPQGWAADADPVTDPLIMDKEKAKRVNRMETPAHHYINHTRPLDLPKPDPNSPFTPPKPPSYVPATTYSSLHASSRKNSRVPQHGNTDDGDDSSPYHSELPLVMVECPTASQVSPSHRPSSQGPSLHHGGSPRLSSVPPQKSSHTAYSQPESPHPSSPHQEASVHPSPVSNGVGQPYHSQVHASIAPRSDFGGFPFASGPAQPGSTVMSFASPSHEFAQPPRQQSAQNSSLDSSLQPSPFQSNAPGTHANSASPGIPVSPMTPSNTWQSMLQAGGRGYASANVVPSYSRPQTPSNTWQGFQNAGARSAPVGVTGRSSPGMSRVSPPRQPSPTHLNASMASGFGFFQSSPQRPTGQNMSHSPPSPVFTSSKPMTSAPAAPSIFADRTGSDQHSHVQSVPHSTLRHGNGSTSMPPSRIVHTVSDVAPLQGYRGHEEELPLSGVPDRRASYSPPSPHTSINDASELGDQMASHYGQPQASQQQQQQHHQQTSLPPPPSTRFAHTTSSNDEEPPAWFTPGIPFAFPPEDMKSYNSKPPPSPSARRVSIAEPPLFIP